MDTQRFSTGEVELPAFAPAAVGPGDAVSDSVGPIGPDEAIEIDGGRARGVLKIMGYCLKVHLNNAPVRARIDSLWSGENPANAQSNQSQNDPSAEWCHSGIPPRFGLIFNFVFPDRA